MATHRVVLSMRKPTYLERRWCRKTKQQIPLACGRTELSTQLMRLVPYRFRGWHHAFATAKGFFWLPCVLCDFPFGGHEDGGSIADPTEGEGRYVMICSQCGREGKGHGE